MAVPFSCSQLKEGQIVDLIFKYIGMVGYFKVKFSYSAFTLVTSFDWLLAFSYSIFFQLSCQWRKHRENYEMIAYKGGHDWFHKTVSLRFQFQLFGIFYTVYRSTSSIFSMSVISLGKTFLKP